MVSDKILEGRFRRIKLLGEGGMSKVFLAEHILLEKKVAIKMVYPGDETAIERLRREATICGGLNHENIISVHDLGTTPDGAFCVVMDYIDGKDLKTAAADKSFLSDEQLFDVLIQVCQGLKYLHDHKIIHRDLKPPNIIVATTSDGKPQARLIDFGIAKEENEDGAVQALTRTGKMAGSPHYMAPEQCQKTDPLDHRVDLYAFGCVLYELIAGRPPFRGSTVLDTLKMHIENKPTTENVPASKLSDALMPVALKCLEKDPEDRYQSAEELIEALKKAHQQFDGSQVRSALDAKKRRMLLGVTGVVLAFIAFFAGKLYSEQISGGTTLAEQRNLERVIGLLTKAEVMDDIDVDSETKAAFTAALDIPNLPDYAACNVAAGFSQYLYKLKQPDWESTVDAIYRRCEPALLRLSDSKNVDKSLGVGAAPGLYLMGAAAINKKGNLSESSRRLNAAIEMAKKYPDSNWTVPPMKLWRAIIYLQTSKPDKAIADLNSIQDELNLLHRNRMFTSEKGLTEAGWCNFLLKEAYSRVHRADRVNEINDFLRQSASGMGINGRSYELMYFGLDQFVQELTAPKTK